MGFWKAKESAAAHIQAFAADDPPVKFWDSSSPIDITVRDLQTKASAAAQVDPECPFCGAFDHVDAMRCGKYLKVSMLEQAAQTAALQSIRRCTVFFAVLAIISLSLGFVIAVFITSAGRR
jgi:hypothetical protein